VTTPGCCRQPPATGDPGWQIGGYLLQVDHIGYLISFSRPGVKSEWEPVARSDRALDEPGIPRGEHPVSSEIRGESSRRRGPCWAIPEKFIGAPTFMMKGSLTQ
jgi:hypothetical protein